MSTPYTQPSPTRGAPSRRLAGTLLGIVSAAIALSAPSPASAHGTPADAGLAGNAIAGGEVALKGCWMTAALAPRSADAIHAASSSPLDLTQTFYGAESLVGIWAMSCDRVTTEARRFDSVVMSLVAIPVGLTSEGALPLANNFAHSLLRIDTSSRPFARVLRREGLPGHFAEGTRFRHTNAQGVPSTGELRVPGKYRISVSATDLDPTNPHDHANEFSYLDRGGELVGLGLVVDDAEDRFCFPVSGGCSVQVRAHSRSPLRALLGDGSDPVTVGFDHAKIDRVDLLENG